MKIFLPFFLSILVSANLFADTLSDTSFTITGNITGIAEGAEVKIEDANTNTVFSTAKVVRGNFTLKGKVPEPTLCWLKITGEAPQYIYVENSSITVSGSKPIAMNFRISGSKSQTEFSEFQKVFNPIFIQLQSVVNTINSSSYGSNRDSLMEIYESVKDSMQVNLDVFVKKFPSSFVTPFILYATAQYYEDPLLLESRFEKMDSTIRVSQIGSSLRQYIVYNKVGAVGTHAIDFSQPDTTGKPVALSSFKGKYVLVDFWASWCGPCRMENPNVVENYHQFSKKNFTVFGVSLDRPGQKEKWMEAIKKDSLTWTHVSDLQFWNNAAAQLYRVSGIPFNLLVDPDGKILARNLRGPELKTKLCELLGCD
ncbi:MAG TPA: TlpA disulfide reductase family protein [Chitinophagaceae bacterium]|nr:TlpA disulfide reductase family protein [Chitinophagaceae bacterium]